MARAGRFGTKGLAVTFVSDETDAKTLNDVQDRFEVNVAELPEEIDISTYSKLPLLYNKPGLVYVLVAAFGYMLVPFLNVTQASCYVTRHSLRYFSWD